MYDFEKEKSLRQEIIDIGKKMNSSGINQGTSGNLSIRIPVGLLITPSSIPYEELKASDLLSIDLDGIPLKNEMSTHNSKKRSRSS